MGWTRLLSVPEGGELWTKLRAALASADDDGAPHLALVLVGIGSATGRRALGRCSHSLRAQLLSGVDAVGAPLDVVHTPHPSRATPNPSRATPNPSRATPDPSPSYP